MSLPRVLGVDGCPGGWVGVLLEPDAVAFTAGSLEGLVALVEPVACVAVDIPLGLPDSTRRQADALARTSLGARGASVFDAAVRAAYEAPSHALGSEAHRRLTGRGLSIQAWNLGPRVLDASEFARRGTHVVVEAHPELSLAAMAGGVLLPPKRSPSGARRRRELLAGAGIAVPARPAPAKEDDLLDACAAAWTARRYALGQALSYPAEPEVFSDGLPAAIWV